MSLNLDSRLTSLTPERLALIAAASGGTVSKTWDHINAPEDGGDGISGHHVVYLANSAGTEMGNVGFARTAKPNGDVTFTVNDFYDERHPIKGRTSWGVHENPQGLIGLLAKFIPAPR